MILKCELFVTDLCLWRCWTVIIFIHSVRSGLTGVTVRFVRNILTPRMVVITVTLECIILIRVFILLSSHFLVYQRKLDFLPSVSLS